MSYTLHLFDDSTARAWDPFALTRPVGELLFGTCLLRERAERFWGVSCEGQLSGEALAGFSEPGAPPVVDLSSLSSDGHRVFQCSRAVLSGPRPDLPSNPATLIVDGVAVGFSVPPGEPAPSPELLRNPRVIPGSERVELRGTTLDAPWNLMVNNGNQLTEDIPRFFPGYAVDELPGCHIMGEGLLSTGSGVRVEPGSVFDVTNGPIRLSDDVVVKAHTRLEGPAFVGEGSTILGGSLSETSIGPVCKVRGEVECSVVLGFSNKAHDGFLGHAYVGRWVNLGAFTTNSDLKNNYGDVRVGGADGPRETNLMKVGCFLGDHVKTGIGTLLNTGTTVGAGSNIFGGRIPPSYVPPFSWGTGTTLTEFRLEKFLEVAGRAMERRGIRLGTEMTALLSRAWEESRRLRNPSDPPSGTGD